MKLILLIVLICSSKCGAQILSGKNISSISKVSKVVFTDSVLELLTKSAQFEKSKLVLIDSVEYFVVISERQTINYISTSDLKFRTIDSFKVGDSYSEIRKTNLYSKGDIIKMPGWGSYLKLESGWNAVFDFREEVRGKSKILFFFQRDE